MNTFFQSPRLLYRPYCMGDIGDLIRLRNEPSYRAWFYFLPPMDQAAAEAEIRRSIRTWSRPADILRDADTPMPEPQQEAGLSEELSRAQSQIDVFSEILDALIADDGEYVPRSEQE